MSNWREFSDDYENEVEVLQLQVMNSPFNEEQVQLLNQLLPQLSISQHQWLSGYLVGITQVQTAMGTGAAIAEPPSTVTASFPLMQQTEGGQQSSIEVAVLYGSQTGNSQALAEKLAGQLKKHGFLVQLTSMSDFKLNQLKKVQHLLIIVSTHGEGEPPDQALSFYEFIHSKRAPKLEGLHYSVLALGDRSYELFCQTGKDFDLRLEALGGRRLCQRVDCDVDYDEQAALWMEEAIQALSALKQSAGSLNGASSTARWGIPSSHQVAQQSADQAVYSRTNPYYAEVMTNINLNGRGSSQETRHLELSLEGSNFQYEPGDCLGIHPQNHPELVNQLITELSLKPDETVQLNKQGDQTTLREALLNHYEITVLTRHLLEQLASLTDHSQLRQLLEAESQERLKNYLAGRDLLDLIQDYDLRGLTASEWISVLRRMPARLYSIASSYKANPDEVHLAIRTVRYQAHGRDRFGVCSVQTAERVHPGDTLPVYIHHNPNFKLPTDPNQPIIMIGPGTGVAPFRSFLEEREELGAEGKSWLFYGDRHFYTDFLYQTDWQRWLKDGVLTKMDVAFSRDTANKIYVQHRMLEKSKELYSWLEEGAHVYVCGDKTHMASDVHRTLQQIIEQEGGKSASEAAAYLANLQQQKRYQRDVY